MKFIRTMDWRCHTSQGRRNYRAVKLLNAPESQPDWAIKEVYYDEGKPTGFCDAMIYADNVDGLFGVLDTMRKDIAAPPLEEYTNDKGETDVREIR